MVSSSEAAADVHTERSVPVCLAMFLDPGRSPWLPAPEQHQAGKSRHADQGGAGVAMGFGRGRPFRSLCLAIRGCRLVGRTSVAVWLPLPRGCCFQNDAVVLTTAAFFDRPASNRALALVRRRARCEQLLPPRNRTSAKAPEVEPPPQAMRRRAYLFGGVE
jgi:hypothetical protein